MNDQTSSRDGASWLVFAGIWVLCASVYVVLRWSHVVSEDLFNGAISFLAGGYPIVSSDISIVGEVTPAVAAGLMVFFAPRQSEGGRIVIYIAFYLFLYLFYVDFTLFADGGNQLLESALGGDNKENLIKSLTAFAGNMRLFAVMTATALAGYWLQPRRGLSRA